MAPKKAKGAPKALLKELAATKKRPVAVKRPSKGPQAALLTLTGFAAAALGLVLTAVPGVSALASRFVPGLEHLGVHGGALLMGGLTLVGLGMVMRRCQQVAVQVAEAGSDSGAMDDLAARVAQLGGTLEGLDNQVRGLREELDVRFGGMSASFEKLGRDLAAQLDQPQAEGLGSEDAIFRLAASLDKVGARIEERLKSQFGDLTQRIGKVESSLQEAAALMEDVASRPAPALDLEPAGDYGPVAGYDDYAPAPGPAYPAAPMHGTQFHSAPGGSTPPPAPGGRGGRAPALHQTQHYPTAQLHQTQHRPAPQLHQTQHHPRPQPQAQPHQANPYPTQYQQPRQPGPHEDPSSLGLLDHLDDDGVRSPLPGGPQGQAQQPSFDALDELSLQVPPPAAGRWDVPQGPGGESLLSDPEMRSALEDLGRQGGR